MFTHPPKRAYAREQIDQVDQSERHGVLINQQNNHYRPGSAAWYAYKDDEGAAHEWPLLITPGSWRLSADPTSSSWAE
jgi:hypothetical protein